MNTCHSPNNLSHYVCPRCSSEHPLDPLWCVAFCPALDHLVGSLMNVWPGPIRTVVTHWWLTQASVADKRNYVHTLLPLSLWSVLDTPVSGHMAAQHAAFLQSALTAHHQALTDAIHSIDKWLRANPLPFDPIGAAHPTTENHWSVKHGFYSTSLPGPPAPMPPPVHRPPSPVRARATAKPPAKAKRPPPPPPPLPRERERRWRGKTTGHTRHQHSAGAAHSRADPPNHKKRAATPKTAPRPRKKQAGSSREQGANHREYPSCHAKPNCTVQVRRHSLPVPSPAALSLGTPPPRPPPSRTTPRDVTGNLTAKSCFN